MSAVAAFKLTAPATQAAAPFVIGHDFKKGDVPAGQYAALDLANFAVVPMRTWNDGSLKRAMLIGRAPLTAGAPLQVNIVSRTTAPAAGTVLTAASIAAAAPTASVQCGSIGTVNLSALLGSPVRTYVSTKEMVECHYKANVGADANLYVWFHVRLFADGRMRVRAIVGNGKLGGTRATKTYAATVIIGGVTVFSAATYYHSMWARYSRIGWIGTDPAVTAQHDTGYLVRTGIFPNYWKSGTATSAQLGYLDSCIGYVPGANLGFSQTMGATGAQDHIGLMPRWDAMYFSMRGHSKALQAVIDGAEAINSYAHTYPDPVTLNPIKIADYPDWGIYGSDGSGSYGEAALMQDGTSTISWELAHHPSAGFLADHLTADYYYTETSQHAAKLTFLMAGKTGGTGTNRLLQNQNRARGWTYRTVSQAAASYPSWMAAEFGDTSTWYASLCALNIAKYSTLTPLQKSLGLENLYSLGFGTTAANGQTVSIFSFFERYFVAQAAGHAVGLEPCAASDAASVAGWANYVTGFVVWPLGGGGATEFPFGSASNYVVAIRSTGSTLISDFTFSDFGQIYSDTFSPSSSNILTNPNTNTLNGSSGGSPTLTDGYYSNLLPGISVAVDLGKTGAAAGFARLTGASNFSLLDNAGYDLNPTWGVVPKSYAQQAIQFNPVDSGATVATPGPSILCDTLPFASAGVYVGKRRGIGIPNGDILDGGSDGTSPLFDRIQAGDSPLIEQIPVVTQGGNGTVQFDDMGAAVYTGTAGSFSLAVYDLLDAASAPVLAGSASFTVGGATAPSPTVTGITANPTTATVAGGSTTNVAIAVQGTNNPPQTFTSSKISGSGSANGAALSMPAANSAAQVGTFRFRPTLDSANHYVDVVLTVAAVAGQPGNPATHVHFALEALGATPVKNASRLHFAFFAQSSLETLQAPIVQGTTLATGSDAFLDFSIAGLSQMQVHDVGTIALSNEDFTYVSLAPVEVL